MKVKITKEIFEIAYSLSTQRQEFFTNQFTTLKLKEQLSDDKVLANNVEGVIGYIGDMCASLILGLDPLNVMRNMVLDTDLLTHRDECDIVFRGNRIDVKTELYPDYKFNSVVNRTISKNETYGCRLINGQQFKENSYGVDVYLYGTIDNVDPRKANYWHAIGWITKNKIVQISPTPSLYSPAGAKLWTPAHCIPNEELEEINFLFKIEIGKHKYFTSHIENPKYQELDKERMKEILSISGL